MLGVPGDEGHRGTAVQQFDGRIHLGRPNLQLGGNLLKNLVQNEGLAETGRALKSGSRRSLPQGRRRLSPASVLD